MSERRGACPGIIDPMPTGDGLLARLIPRGSISVADFLGLLTASTQCGNGIVEITQRGSVQIRGLSENSAPRFAQILSVLGLGETTGPPLLSSPLLGLAADEAPDSRTLLAELQATLSSNPHLRGLGPKVTVVFDASPYHLGAVRADLRLIREPDGQIEVSVAGSSDDAVSLGRTSPARAPSVASLILEHIASRGPTARARDFTGPAEVRTLRSLLAAQLGPSLPRAPRTHAEPIGVHALQSGRVALGIALPFGYAHATLLERLLILAARFGAESVRPAPGRALFILGLPAGASPEFTAAAASLGFIVTAQDPRRFVVACAGAPACASASLSTRQLAPAIAAAADGLLDGSTLIHVSGCAKGCAHRGSAALTLVGPDQLIVHGNARSSGDAQVSPQQFISGLKRLAAQADERASGGILLSQLGAQRIAQCMSEPLHA